MSSLYLVFSEISNLEYTSSKKEDGQFPLIWALNLDLGLAFLVACKLRNISHSGQAAYIMIRMK